MLFELVFKLFRNKNNTDAKKVTQIKRNQQYSRLIIAKLIL